MGDTLVECVPNFSEGRDESIINEITESILKVSDVTLLDVDIGYDFNRTVVTIVGKPEAVLEAATQRNQNGHGFRPVNGMHRARRV